MSRNINKNKNFLGLILSTNTIQAKGLLNTISSDQLRLIEEIAYNLLNLPLSEKEKNIVKNQKSFIRKLSNKKIKVSEKKKIIRRYKTKLLNILLILKLKLLSLLG